jgi:hypothetical protein
MLWPLQSAVKSNGGRLALDLQEITPPQAGARIHGPPGLQTEYLLRRGRMEFLGRRREVHLCRSISMYLELEVLWTDVRIRTSGRAH